MSRVLIEKYRQRAAQESGSLQKPRGGRLAIALVYPNTYYQGMSNLGMQTVYLSLNAREDVLCERFFLPDPEDIEEHRRTSFPLVSIETQTPLDQFDLVAFSVSFELDFINIPTLLELGRLPLWRTERDERHPLFICGGVCAFLNPEPLAEIMDLFVVGEAEPILPSLLDVLCGQADLSRANLLEQLSQLSGLYQPAGYDFEFDDGGKLLAIVPRKGFRQKVARQWQEKLDTSQSRTCVSTAETEFGKMRMVEVSRGCPRACRFCAAGFIYRPFREHSVSHLEDEILASDQGVGRVGLVAAAVSDYEDLAELGDKILSKGGEVSVSSVRIDAISQAQVKVLVESGHKTLALAPEAGSQRMRDLVNKGVDEEQILSAVQMLAEGGILNLKLYFMIGLPTETADDVNAIAALSLKIRDAWEAESRRKGRLGRLQLSVNPFVPKPWTPLQWAPMEKRSSLEKKYRLLQKRLRSVPNVDLNFESLRHAELQALLSRGDRRVGDMLPHLAQGKSMKAAARFSGIDLSYYLHRERDVDELFPWEIIDQGVKRSYLRKEFEHAMQGAPGGVCSPDCSRCGLKC